MTQKNTIALFTYGGGMRGLVPAHIMSRFEETTGLAMSDMVDIFTGPSTGAILNAAMNMRHPHHPDRPKYKARHMVRFYEREGLTIFPQDRFREFRGFIHDFNNRTMRLNQLNTLFRHGHYDPSNLMRALKLLYGRARLGDSLRSLVVPTYNIDGDQIHAAAEHDENGQARVRTRNNFISEGGHALWLKHIEASPTTLPARYAAPEVYLYDAVLASCAAPTYFPCHHFNVRYADQRGDVFCSGIDGSIFDNPCISYHGAIRPHIPQDHQLTMITLGTGYTHRSYKKDEWNRFGALGVVDPVNDLPLINIFFHASESALMEAFGVEMADHIHVFNKSMTGMHRDDSTPSMQIDDASPENLARLKRFAEIILEDNKQQFEDVCHLLVSNYDRRRQDSEHKSFTARALHYFTGLSDKGKKAETPVSAPESVT